jgi:hypothetical protein
MAIKQGSLAKSIVNEYMYFIAIVNTEKTVAIPLKGVLMQQVKV